MHCAQKSKIKMADTLFQPLFNIGLYSMGAINQEANENVEFVTWFGGDVGEHRLQVGRKLHRSRR